MDYDGFPVAASVLSAQALAGEVLSRYPLAEPVRCHFLQKGLNDTYSVHTGSGRFYLRVYRHGWRSEQEVEAEIGLLNHLDSDGQAVSVPVAKRDGSFLTALDAPEGTRYAVLFTEAPGKRPTFDLATCEQFGVIVANLHASMDHMPEDSRRSPLNFAHLVDEPLSYIEPMLSQRRREAHDLSNVAAALTATIDDLLPTTGPEFGGCHGDHQGGNVHQDADGRMVVFDFDCAGRGWRAYDLAVFRWQAEGPAGLNHTGNDGASAQWKAFLGGYAQVRSLTGAEIEATRLFVPIRRIWWMGMHARLAQTIGPSPVPNLAGLDRDSLDAWFDHQLGLVRRAVDGA